MHVWSGADESSREEIVVDQSLLTIDRQMGVVICTPDGKVRSSGWADGVGRGLMEIVGCQDDFQAGTL